MTRTMAQRNKILVGHPGSKGQDGVSTQILKLLPPHRVYVELYLGSGQTMARKAPAQRSIGVEIDPAVLLEYGPNYPDAELMNVPTLEALRTLRTEAGADWLFYADPPYLRESRLSGDVLYTFEMLLPEHHMPWLRAAVEFQQATGCMFAISHYPHQLYDDHLLPAGWHRHTFKARTRGGTVTEAVYTSYPRPILPAQYDRIGRDTDHRRDMRRKRERWATNLLEMPEDERLAMIHHLALATGFELKRNA